MGDVLNKAPEQRHTCGDTVGSFLRLHPNQLRAVKAKGKWEISTVCRD